MRFILNGLDLNDVTNGFTVQPDLEGAAGLPPIRITTGTNAGRNGGWSSQKFYDPRSINVKGIIFSTSLADMEQKRRELAAVIAQDELTLEWLTDGGNDYAIKVRATSFSMPISKARQQQSFQIVLRADDPIWYDISGGGDIVATLPLFKEIGGFEIPFNIPLPIGGGGGMASVENTGTTTVYPSITIKGVAHTPQIVNQTTNQTFTLQIDNGENDTIVINSSPTLQTVTQNGGNIYSSIKDGSQFITIAPGVNKMALKTADASDDAIAEIRYQSGYLGV